MAGYGEHVPALVVRAPGHLAGTRWQLTRDAHVVGRYGDIRLPAPDVSKRHAELRRGSDGVWLNDLHSSNGVLLNGVRLAPDSPVRLSDGDELRFGSVQVVYQSNGYGVTDLRDHGRRTQPPRRPDQDLPTGPVHHADPPPVADDSRSSSTRYLSAATQLDPWFADVVVRQVVDEPFRALAPVFGADLGIVTRWALSARRRRLLRDAVLRGILIALLTLLGTGLHSHQEAIAKKDFGGWQSYAVRGAVLFTLAWLTVAVDLWVTHYLQRQPRLQLPQQQRQRRCDQPRPERPQQQRRQPERLTALTFRRPEGTRHMERGDDYSFHGNTVSGGTINHGKDVRNYYGPNAGTGDAAELPRRLDDLQRLLAQYAAHLPDADAMRDDTEQLGSQPQRERPNPSVVRGLLDFLTAGAGSVTAVLAAVNGLTAFVSRLL